MRCLVTGATGFVGGHLLRELASAGHAVLATRRGSHVRPVPPAADAEAGASSSIEWRALDLLDPLGVARCVETSEIDAVLHLGAVTFVPEVERYRSHAFAVNANGTLHLLEAVRAHAPEARFLLVSSSHVYADSDGSIDESARVAPPSFYGLTKAAAEQVASHYRGEGLPIWIARAFNHIGPHQSAHFAVASFARQIAEIESGARPPRIEVGNLAVERDFTDVRDVVRAYRLLAEGHAEPGTYNVASGRAVPMSAILEALRAASRATIEVAVDPRRMRTGEQRSVSGDASKLRAATGWSPRITLEASLREILDAAREDTAEPPS